MKRLICMLLLISGLTCAVWGAPTQAKHTFAITIGQGEKRQTIVSGDDLVEFSWTDQTFQVSYGVIRNIPQLTASGLSFDLEVDGKRIYRGRFVSAISSMVFNEPTILIEPVQNAPKTLTLRIDRSYHGEARYLKGPDVRFDERIWVALGSLGKLKGDPNLAATDGGLTKAIGEILMESRKIVPGMTRADLLKIFATEGGLSTAKQRTYAHRRCPYIKIDVEFKLTDAKQGVIDERPTDTVSKVSRLYLDWTISD